MNQHRLNAASAYQSVGLHTRAASNDQHQLVNMMFEAVLENINKIRGAIQQGDVQHKIKHIDHTIRIIQEGLTTSLDHENGGELAGNLARLYDYAVIRLVQANAKNDVNTLLEVAELFAPLLEAWKQMRPDGAAPSPAEVSPALVVVAANPPDGLVEPVAASPGTASRRSVGAYASVAAYGRVAAPAGV
ncbi:MAG: flagellar export chaperone FliS [Hydrogenophaga sp.]|nr:flagellar export chaperone FliS [Hydrogenophaga sp.]